MRLFRRKDRVKRDYSALLERRNPPAPERAEPLMLRERHIEPATAARPRETTPILTQREPYQDRIHREELAALDDRLRALMNGETAQELEGQRALVGRLKTNLKDNRSKLRRTLRDLKSMRRKMEAQQKDLFDKAMKIDRQNAELRVLRERPVLEAPVQSPSVSESMERLREKLSQTQRTLDAVLSENRDLKIELAAIRKRDAEREAEMALLRSEHQTMTERQSDLLTQIADMQVSTLRSVAKDPVSIGTGAEGFAQIKELNRALSEAREREELMQQRLDIVKRDLDIVGQINTMLRSRVDELENQSAADNYPNRAVGF